MEDRPDSVEATARGDRPAAGKAASCGWDVADAAPPLPVAAARLLRNDDGRWRIDPAVAVDHSWHGACLVSRTDGYVVGIVLAEEVNVYVAPVEIGDR